MTERTPATTTTKQTKSLTDSDITSERTLTRRSLLAKARTVSLAAGAMVGTMAILGGPVKASSRCDRVNQTDTDPSDGVSQTDSDCT